MAVAQHSNPFDEAYNRANLSYPQLPGVYSGLSSADASVAANDSSASLVDPMLENDGTGQNGRAAHSTNEQHSVERVEEQVSNHTQSPGYETTRQAGQKPTKIVGPIRIPRRSETSQQQHDGMRSPATGLSSAALTSSFPMPPLRTPASSSPAGTFGSPALSGHGHSQKASTSSGSGTRSHSPQDASARDSPVQQLHSALPRKLLSVPPPTPAFSDSRASTSLGLYWEGETSSVRNSGSHPAPSAVLPYYSPDPAAYVRTPLQEEPYTRINSFAAEYSTPLPSRPASPSYPPRAYSPAGSSDISRNGTRQSTSSPFRHDREHLLHSPANQALRPLLHRSHSDYSEEPNYRRQRRESSGTFGTVYSSSPSIGMNQAIDTLENEDFGSTGTRTTTHTRNHSEVSMTSSPGMTHELVRRGDVFESLPSGTQKASRRLARASLVSSELLRSAHSIDALRSVLAEDPAYAVDKDYEGNASRRTTRMRHSHRYSSGPAPTLASLAEDEDDHISPSSDLDYMQVKRKSRHRSGNKRPYDHMPRQNSDWANKSSKSYSSHRSGKSSAQFTVASHAPTLPSLHNSSRRAEIAVKEATIPFKKLARRASTLGDILDNMPEPEQYVSYPSEDGRAAPSYDEISELRYSNQLRKARRKVEVGVPNLWSSHTPVGSVSTGIQGTGNAHGQSEMQEVYASKGNFHVHPEAELDNRHFRRRKSYPASELQEAMSLQTEKASSSGLYGRSSFSSSGSQDEDEHATIPAKKLSYWQTLPPQKKKKVRLVVIFVLGLVIAAAIGAAVPLSKNSRGEGAAACDRTCSGQSKAVLQGGVCTCQCSDSRAGPFCDLDTTCVCPSGSPDCAHPLAKSLVNAASYASTLFAPPINATRLAASLARLDGGQGGCASQLSILETPNLDPSQYKARRRWTQAVFLWDAATSEEFSNKALYDFQSGLSYWQWQDSPSFEAQPSFQINTHGYSVDFAYQRVFVMPRTLDELDVSQTSIARLSNASASALERVGAFSMAASTQRASALFSLFDRLGYDASQLASFRSTIMASPVYFPFDIGRSLDSQSTMAIAFRNKDNGASFPLPATCTPDLPAGQLAELNRVEADVFGLPTASTSTDVQTNCTDRPIYGMLNILNWRLPFLDGQRPQQAIVISDQDRKRRLTFSVGPILTPLLYSNNIDVSTLTTTSFGHISALDNVLFDYLSQLPGNGLVTALIDYILSGVKTPPLTSSTLGSLSNGLQDLPVVEAQAWGGLQFSDIDYIVSGIGRTGANVLFGSDSGAELRTWAHSGQSSKPIRWASEATSGEYALDSGGSELFQGAWDTSRSSSAAAISTALGASNLFTS